jgi:hypothetical protein
VIVKCPDGASGDLEAATRVRDRLSLTHESLAVLILAIMAMIVDGASVQFGQTRRGLPQTAEAVGG